MLCVSSLQVSRGRAGWTWRLCVAVSFFPGDMASTGRRPWLYFEHFFLLPSVTVGDRLVVVTLILVTAGERGRCGRLCQATISHLNIICHSDLPVP